MTTPSKAEVPINAELREKLRSDPAAGPRPITLEEYRARITKRRPVIEVNQQKDNQESLDKKKGKRRRGVRAGKAVKDRKEIANLYRLAAISVTKKERKLFLNNIRTIRSKNQERKQQDRWGSHLPVRDETNRETNIPQPAKGLLYLDRGVKDSIPGN